LQGRGIGTEVVRELEEKARSRGVSEIYLESWKFPDTIGFYEHMDKEHEAYKRKGTHEWRYKDMAVPAIYLKLPPEQNIVMSKQLVGKTTPGKA